MEINKISLSLVVGFVSFQILFLILKFSGAINWSWVWILAPLWIPYAVILLIVAVIVIYLTVGNLVNRRKNNG